MCVWAYVGCVALYERETTLFHEGEIEVYIEKLEDCGELPSGQMMESISDGLSF